MYAERASRLPGAVVWTRVLAGTAPSGGTAAAPALRTETASPRVAAAMSALASGAEHGDGRGAGHGDGRGAGTEDGSGTARSAVLPDGCMDLLWTEGRLLVAGPDTRPYIPDAVPGGWAGVRFFPGTAPAYLGVPASELRDRRVELTDLWPASEVRRLTARIDAAADPVEALEEVALLRAAEAEPPDPLLREVVAALDAGRPVRETADGLGLGARQLHRRSLAAFGYGPKTLARVLRLQRALALARAGVPFAETALRAGFADQAHLARDVKELAGATLGELVGHR
ncbi:MULTISPECIES: helix-turn-helix domain-containing protein [unclassified Streptomyces]|uniref:helix-turn-helix domain-containing protein n=1 Tax=unclassified Streptomyces TaxID=2593676 RepID=UPI00225209F5|nr:MULTISPECIES: helix-turn-helix domain-containing protein [unclassified Streptomyces]MCX4987748.1 helix-turn-helix domain-containing protein [Streptomyces sp. NBC_00568]MCX5007119.1 helix-turn-helix domain-containing protein [Streptomyces sp. NBC_00638]